MSGQEDQDNTSDSDLHSQLGQKEVASTLESSPLAKLIPSHPRPPRSRNSDLAGDAVLQ